MKEETEGEWWKWAMRAIINILRPDDLAQLFAMPFFLAFLQDLERQTINRSLKDTRREERGEKIRNPELH